MPGRRVPSRRGNQIVGGSSPTLRGSLVLSDTAFSLNVTEGDTLEYTDGTFTLSNGGPGNWNNPQYAITYGSASGWLSLAATLAGPDTRMFVPTIDATALTPAIATATVTFTDGNVTNTGQTVVFTLTVDAASPSMGVSPPSLSFTIVDETEFGTPQTVTVTNITGLGTLATPTIGTITGAGAAYIDNVGVSGSAGGPYTVTVTPTAVGGSVGGPYAATIPILSSGAVNTPIDLPVSITVTTSQTAIIGLSRSLDDAQFVIGGAAPSTQTVGVVNDGTGSFAGVSISSTTYGGVASGWGTATIANNIVSVAIDTSGIVTEGTSTCNVVLADANAASTATYTVLLKSSQAVLSPFVSVSPASVGFTVNNGSNGFDRLVTVTNVNGSFVELGTVTASLSPGVSWATIASFTNGVATLSFPTNALANGTYATSLVVTASLASNSPVTIPITATVQAAPTGFAAPPFALPTGASHSTSTDAITYDPFSSPPNPSGFA